MKTKTCTKCGVEKPLLEFHKSKKGKYGRNSVCKKCQNKYYREKTWPKIREEKIKYGKERRLKNPEIYRTYELKKKYGITYKQKQQMYLDQNGCCALCDNPIPLDDVKVDHNHITNKIHALLCPRCNIGMGYIDDVSFREKGLSYKKQYD